MEKNDSKTRKKVKQIKVPNYDANVSRIKINRIIEEKNAEKMRKKIKLVFTFIFIAVFICTIYVISRLPYFNIDEVRVENNSIYTSDEIISASNIELGKNIFLERFFGSVKVNLPYIEEAKIKLMLPNKIKIVVKERESAYFAKDLENNVYYKIDASGYVLEKVEDIKLKSDNEVLISGISFGKDFILGTRLDDAYVKMLGSYKEIEKKLYKSSINMKVTSVNFKNSLTTVTLDDKLNVRFSQTGDINYSISMLKAILDKLPEGSSGIIDMTKNDPIYSSY